MRRAVPSALLLATTTLFLGACGSDEPRQPIQVSAGESGAEMWFSPDDATVAAGNYTVELRNTGIEHHELAVVHPQGRVLGARSIPGGSSASFDVDLDTPGTYQLWCREPGHTEAGMHGTLTVR